MDGIRSVSDCSVSEKMRARNIKVMARREEERSSEAAKRRYAHRTVQVNTLTDSEGNEGRTGGMEHQTEGTLLRDKERRLAHEDGCKCLRG